MKTKQTIEVEGLPEGYRAVSYRKPKDDDDIFLDGIITKGNRVSKSYEQLIVEKIQPHRIVLEETGEVRRVTRYDWCEIDGKVVRWTSPGTSACEYKIWREVKETDLSLTNDEPKLSLSVDECKSLFGGSRPRINRIR